MFVFIVAVLFSHTCILCTLTLTTIVIIIIRSTFLLRWTNNILEHTCTVTISRLTYPPLRRWCAAGTGTGWGAALAPRGRWDSAGCRAWRSCVPSDRKRWSLRTWPQHQTSLGHHLHGSACGGSGRGGFTYPGSRSHFRLYHFASFHGRLKRRGVRACVGVSFPSVEFNLALSTHL